MDIRHDIQTINDETPVLILPDFGDAVQYYVNFTVQNISETTVYLGASGVTSTDYGIKLEAGAIASFDGFQRNAQLFGVTDSWSASVAVLRISQ